GDGRRRGLVLILVLEPAGEEEHLEVERPPVHVPVEVREIRVVVHALEEGGPAEVLGEDLGERALPRADVAGDGDVGLGAPALGVGVGGGDGERGLHGRRPGCAAKIARGAPASATGPGAPALFTPASVIVPRRAEPRTTAPVLSSG